MQRAVYPQSVLVNLDIRWPSNSEGCELPSTSVLESNPCFRGLSEICGRADVD